MKEFGTKVKHRREELGISQTELARRMGYSDRSTISKIENGERSIPLEKLKDLCIALSVNPAYFIEWQSMADFFEKIDFSDDELKEIMQFVEFVKSKRK